MSKDICIKASSFFLLLIPHLKLLAIASNISKQTMKTDVTRLLEKYHQGKGKLRILIINLEVKNQQCKTHFQITSNIKLTDT